MRRTRRSRVSAASCGSSVRPVPGGGSWTTCSTDPSVRGHRLLSGSTARPLAVTLPILVAGRARWPGEVPPTGVGGSDQDAGAHDHAGASGWPESQIAVEIAAHGRECPDTGRHGLERLSVSYGASGYCGAPGGTRTHDLQVRNLTLYPLSYGRTRWVAEREGFRTLDAGYPTWRFSNGGPGVRHRQPALHSRVKLCVASGAAVACVSP